MIWLILISVHTILANIHIETADIRNKTAGVTWFEAKSLCDTLEYNVTILSGLDELQNKSFWLGISKYEVMTPWMYPTGCYDFQQTQNKAFITRTIGLCQHICNWTTLFGYKEPRCICLNSSEVSDESKANLSKCRNNTIGAMMVYSVFRYPLFDTSKEECMIKKCDDNGRHLSPLNCSKITNSAAVVCDDNLTAVGDNQWYANYQIAEDKCFLKNRLLLSPYHCPNQNGIYGWTSAFRELLQIEDSSAMLMPMATQECLSGTRNILHTIDLTPRNCNDLLSLFVCRSNVQVPSSSNPALSGFLPKDSRSSGGLIGGIIGGVALILVASAVLLWIWWKRKNDEKSKRINSEKIDTVSTMQYSLAMSTVIKNDDQLNKGETNLHNYSTVQKHNKEDTVDSVYVSAKEEEYDELNNISSRKIHQGPSNTYGFLGQSDEGEYDTMKGVSNGFGNSTEDMYDSNVPNCKGISDNTYDTANINHFRTK